MKIIGVFNNKGGVGKTSLVYHLSWMFAEMGHVVVAADLDPQANLSAMFMDDGELENAWENGKTVHTALLPLMEGTGGIAAQDATRRGENIFLIVGDMRLSGYEDELSSQWAQCLSEGSSAKRAFRVETAFFSIIQNAIKAHEAAYVLVDVGPNLGAINRAALLACDYIITPLSPDLFSWQGLRNMDALGRWRRDWEKCRDNFDDLKISDSNSDLMLPDGGMQLLGYIAMRFSIHASRPVKSYQKWIDKMPAAFMKLIGKETQSPSDVREDENCLSILKDYHSLMPMAQEAKKPMFQLTAADGIIGSHTQSVKNCKKDFWELAEKIITKIETSS